MNTNGYAKQTVNRAAGLLLTLTVLLGTATAFSETLHWGAGHGAWSIAGNWDENMVPSDGDTLLFPNNGLNANTTNDLVGLNLDAIWISANQDLYGNAVGVSSQIVVFTSSPMPKPMTIDMDIELNGDVAITANASGSINAQLQIYGDINVGSHTLSVGDAGIYVGAPIYLYGAVSGSGSVTKFGDGIVYMAGTSANTYSGTTRVEEGTLVLDQVSGNSVPYDLIIGGNGIGDPVATVRQNAPSKIGSDVTINASGTYDMNGYTETINDFYLYGGAGFDSGLSKLSIRGDVTVDGGVSSISGQLGLLSGTHDFNILYNGLLIWPGAHCHLNADVSGMGNLIKKGPGDMRISGSNTYSGTTLVENGDIMIESDTALGTTDGGTTVNTGSKIYISAFSTGASKHIVGEALSLAGEIRSYGVSNSWTGAITLTDEVEIHVASGGAFDLSGAIGGSGGLTKEWAGTLIFSGSSANTYPGDTFVKRGVLELNKTGSDGAIFGQLVIGDGVGGSNTDIVRLKRSNQIANTADMVVSSSGLFDLDSHYDRMDAVTGSGSVKMGHGYLIAGHNGSSFTFDGLVSGSGYLWKVGSGTWTLTANNTYSGTTQVETGTLLVNGSQPASDISVEAAGTLGGTGTVGVIFSSGTVTPGASAGQLGSGSATLQSGSTFDVELNGYNPVDYDQLDVSGSIMLATANLSISWGFVPAVGDSFTILDNDGADAVAGTFNGLAEGASMVAGNVTLQITYTGGTGNDVVLAATEVEELEPLAITSIGTAGGDVGMEWTGGMPFYVVEKKTNLTNGTWQAVTVPTRDMDATLPADTTNGFYRVTGGN